VDIDGGPGDGIPGNPLGPGKPCIATDFRLRVRARDDSGIRSVEVFLDGKLVKRSTTSPFFVTIKAEDLPAGRHTIRVVARGNDGDRTVTKRSFRHCNPVVLPGFTG